MSISFKLNHQPDVHQAIDLYVSVEWGTKEQYDASTSAKAFQNLDMVVTAYDGDALVGMTRVLSDKFTVTYVVDIAVSPLYQNKGIGTEMIKRVQDAYADTAIYVAGLASAEAFFEKCGISKRAALSSFSAAPSRAAA